MVVVSEPGEHAGVAADAAVTAVAGCSLAIRSADCAPVVIVGARAVGVLHAGWRGLMADVVANTVAAMRALDDGPLRAHLGPCIRPGCYEFGATDLDVVAERFGAGVRSRTMWGTPSLDVPRVVALALAEAGVSEVGDDAGCTACDERWYSHRARAETGRFATVAWRDPS